MNVCPKGHEGRGILISMDHVNCADGSPAFIHHYECELCGEHWIDDECDWIDDEYNNEFDTDFEED